MSIQEHRQILELLDTGEWGPLSESVMKLRKKIERILKLEYNELSLFEDIEQRRTVVLRKRIEEKKIGICMSHGRYSDCEFVDRVQPIAKLRWVECVREIMCLSCLDNFRADMADGRKGQETSEITATTLTSEVAVKSYPLEMWREFERYLKLPSLRDYEELWLENVEREAREGKRVSMMFSARRK